MLGSASPIGEPRHLLDQITTLCPKCLKSIPGVVLETETGVVMEKNCPDHGSFEAVICTDLELYSRLCEAPRKVTKPRDPGSEVNKGSPNDCGLCPSHDQHTCLAILEIVSNCDLQCPVCLADAPVQGNYIEVPVLKSALKSLDTSEGDVAPLQTGGGEPALWCLYHSLA